MKKILVALFGIFLLAACGSKTDIAPTQATSLATSQSMVDAPTSEVSCSAVSAEPTLAPGSGSLFPPVTDADFALGPEDAAVTILEYCDFQAEGCSTMSAVIAQLLDTHEDVRFVFRPFPLTGVLDKSEQAVMAVLAADEQGQFWAMYDLLFERYDDWMDLSSTDFKSWLLREAATTGLDLERFIKALDSPETQSRLDALYENAKTLNIPAVPLVFINGVLQPSFVLDYQNMSDAIGLILLGGKQFTNCPSFDIDPRRQYIATIQTEKGEIVIQLFPDKAPLAVNSFVFLARQGWYDGVPFHRVIPGFAAQAGDPSGTGRGTPGYLYRNEISSLKFDVAGRVAMANFGPDTNGSQFFITYSAAPHLDGAYTIFGQVISGQEVAEKLAAREPSQGGILPVADKVITILVEEK